MIREREGTDVSKQVLFAVLGMSPAVLTETVWALAHEPQPIVPDSLDQLRVLDASQRDLPCCLHRLLPPAPPPAAAAPTTGPAAAQTICRPDCQGD